MSELKADELEHIAYMQTLEIQSLNARIAELEALVVSLGDALTATYNSLPTHWRDHYHCPYSYTGLMLEIKKLKVKEGYGGDRLDCLKDMIAEFALLRQGAINYTRNPTIGSASSLSITSVILIDSINAFVKSVLEARNIDYEQE